MPEDLIRRNASIPSKVGTGPGPGAPGQCSPFFRVLEEMDDPPGNVMIISRQSDLLTILKVESLYSQWSGDNRLSGGKGLQHLDPNPTTLIKGRDNERCLIKIGCQIRNAAGDNHLFSAHRFDLLWSIVTHNEKLDFRQALLHEGKDHLHQPTGRIHIRWMNKIPKEQKVERLPAQWIQRECREFCPRGN